MATRFYLSNTTAPYSPATLRGSWDDTVSAVTRALHTSKEPFGGVTALASRAETNVGSGFDVLLYRGVSGPLDAQTLSGTVNLAIAVAEASVSADFYWHVHIYVTSGDSDTPRGTLLSDYVENTTNEWPTGAGSALALQTAQSISSLAISTGDRIVVEIGYVARNSVTTSFNGQLRYGVETATGVPMTADLSGSGDTNQTTRAPWIEFSGTFAEDSTTVGVRDTQFGVLSLGVGTATAVRDTQFGVLSLGVGTATEVRDTQFGVLVITQQAPAIYTGSGTIQTSGSAAVSKTNDYVGSGTITTGGAGTTSFEPVAFVAYPYTGSGTIIVDGAATVTITHGFDGSGTIVIDGAADVCRTWAFDASLEPGIIIIDGTADPPSVNLGWIGSGVIVVYGESDSHFVSGSLTRVLVEGTLYDQRGNIITYGRLYLRPKRLIFNNGFPITPQTVSIEVPDTGVVSFLISPSYGVPYFVEYDPDPSLESISRRVKPGYFRDNWTIPSSGPVDIATL